MSLKALFLDFYNGKMEVSDLVIFSKSQDEKHVFLDRETEDKRDLKVILAYYVGATIGII